MIMQSSSSIRYCTLAIVVVLLGAFALSVAAQELSTNASFSNASQ